MVPDLLHVKWVLIKKLITSVGDQSRDGSAVWFKIGHLVTILVYTNSNAGSLINTVNGHQSYLRLVINPMRFTRMY